MSKKSTILDRHGNPFEVLAASPYVDLDDPSLGGAFSASGGASGVPESPHSRYLGSLRGLNSSPASRARSPLANSPWMYSAAMAVAQMIGQARLGAFAERVESVGDRRVTALRHGLGHSATGGWAPPRGRRRQAQSRHCRSLATRLAAMKSTEEVDGHPFTALIDQPNPLQDGFQLIQSTVFGLAAGEAFWVFLGADLQPTTAEDAHEIWPAPSASMRARFGPTGGGIFDGWDFSPPSWHPLYAVRRGGPIELGRDNVAQFKLAGPEDPVRGFSPFNAAAASIESYFQVRTANRSLINNDSTPRGILTANQKVSKERQSELEQRWKEKYAGAQNTGGTAMLYDMVYTPTGLSPREMEFTGLLDVDRREQLAVMRTAESVLGLSEFANYATKLGEDRDFLEKNVLPIMRSIERVADKAFFFGEGDNLFPMFDLSSIEALRAGVSDKIKDAKALCGTELHMPPRVAFGVVGLDVPKYAGDEDAFAGAGLVTSSEIVEGLAASLSEPAAAPPVDPPAPGGDGDDDPAQSDVDAADERVDGGGAPGADLQSRAPVVRTSVKKHAQGSRHRKFLAIEKRAEGQMARAYLKWVRDDRRATLGRFDELATDTLRGGARKLAAVPTSEVLTPLKALASGLQIGVRPAMSDALDLIFTFSQNDFGVLTFDISDEAFAKVFATFEAELVGESAARLSLRARDAIEAGVRASETVQAIRQRLAEVYKVAASSSRTLLVSRTYTAGFMNGVREEMFIASDVEEGDWSNAADEHVRDDHLLFQDAGAKPLGFNYQEIAEVFTGGILEFPGDPRAPFGQRANCRCLKLTTTSR